MGTNETNDKDDAPPKSLSELEAELRQHSHDDTAMAIVEGFSRSLHKQTRGETFEALLRPPILLSDVEHLGFTDSDYKFSILQGDIIRTEAAYFLGNRISGAPKYMVLNSSCDLTPAKSRKSLSLLRVQEVVDPNHHSFLLTFRRRNSMYLPRLPDDPPHILCNSADFDGICQIEPAYLLLANRVASLSLVGWRIFGCLSRTIIMRATASEIKIREALERSIGNSN